MPPRALLLCHDAKICKKSDHDSGLFEIGCANTGQTNFADRFKVLLTQTAPAVNIISMFQVKLFLQVETSTDECTAKD